MAYVTASAPSEVVLFDGQRVRFSGGGWERLYGNQWAPVVPDSVLDGAIQADPGCIALAAPAAARFTVEEIDEVLTVRDHERDDWITHKAQWTPDKAAFVRDMLVETPQRVRLFTWARESAQ